jgi:acetyl esterase/lipase
VICPGGGYFGISSIKEGRDVAQRFAENGVAAFVLKYRLPDDKIMADKTTAPLQDVQQAIYQVRQHSAQWQIKPDQVGVMGFSAGGHLASTAATHFSAPVRANLTPAQVRPDFQILLYPVITMREDITHQSSRDFLLGKAAAEELVATYSNELRVKSDTPQAFLVHSNDDEVVPVANALNYYEALIAHQVPVQLLLLPDGGHGYGMRYTYDWFVSLLEWMDSRQLLTAD